MHIRILALCMHSYSGLLNEEYAKDIVIGRAGEASIPFYAYWWFKVIKSFFCVSLLYERDMRYVGINDRKVIWQLYYSGDDYCVEV